MAIDLSHRDTSPSVTHSTRDSVSVPSATSNSAPTSNAYPVQEAASTTSGFRSSVKKRRHSKPKTGKSLPRSLSTPHLRASVMSDSDIDKKRNKLGYQRISIACAHCRRRKIRCLVAEGDSQSRCQNCIRLKKECVFYPVDQQSAIENRSQSSGKTGMGTGPSSAVSASPPEVGSGRPFDEIREPGGLPTVPSNAPASYQGLPLEPGSALPNQGPINQSEYGYQQAEARSPWHAPGGFPTHSPPAPSGPPDHSNQQYWRFNQGRPPEDFAPFQADGMQPPPHPHSAHPFAFSQHRTDHFWQQQPQPMRSMSYGQVEGVTNNDAYTGEFHPHQSQHAASMRHAPPSLTMQNPVIMGLPPGPQSAPIGHQHHMFHHYALPNEPNHVSSTSMGQNPAYAGSWYSEPPSFVPIEDEQQAERSARELPRYILHPNQPG